MKTVAFLNRLERIKADFSPGSARKKLQLLTILGRRRLSSARQLIRLHDLLCFIYAYPDNREIFQRVRSMITGFGRRSDLRSHRQALASTGIAGTVINYRFYWPMARWLSRNWPEQFHLDAEDIEHPGKLANIVPLLVPYSEFSGFDDFDYSPLEWLERLKGNAETTARFFISRLEHTYCNDFEREAIHDDLSPGYQLFPGPGTPDSSNTIYKHARITWQTSPLDSTRPDTGTTLRRSSCVPRRLSATAGEELLNLARKTMVTHERDLDAFSYGNPRDVCLIDYDDGYQTACIGILPERRYLIHATYGLLNLKNGIPVGYYPISTAFNTADVAFNLFAPYRGAEAVRVYIRNMIIAHKCYGVRTFIVDPYQLGHNNDDGLRSGVWWFYYKLGFRPRKKQILQILQTELSRLKRTPGYRSDLNTLNTLASESMYFDVDVGTGNDDTLLRLCNISPAISAYLADRYGSERERGIQACSKATLELTGQRSSKGYSRDELRAWERWSPLILNLGNINRWSETERRELIRIIRAKGQGHESDYLSMLNHHPRLRTAILQFADSVRI